MVNKLTMPISLLTSPDREIDYLAQAMHDPIEDARKTL